MLSITSCTRVPKMLSITSCTRRGKQSIASLRSWEAPIDEQCRLMMARAQEHNSHTRIGWEVQEVTSSFFAFSIYMLLEQAWLNGHHARLPAIPRTMPCLVTRRARRSRCWRTGRHSWPCMRVMRASAPWCAALDNLPGSPPLSTMHISYS
jgi:hypothetical protein